MEYEIERAINILATWKNCTAKEDGNKCIKGEDEYCGTGCWSISEMCEAIDIAIVALEKYKK